MKYALVESNEHEVLVELFSKTFSDSEGEQEGKLIGNLVRDLIDNTPERDIKVFGAKDNEVIVATILFTRLAYVEEQASFLMAPVAVHTDYQGKGIGQALIRYGLEAMQARGAKLAFTYGDPNFYTKVGFKPVSEELFKAPLKLSYPHGWMMQPLAGDSPHSLASKPVCVDGFNHPEFW